MFIILLSLIFTPFPLFSLNHYNRVENTPFIPPNRDSNFIAAMTNPFPAQMNGSFFEYFSYLGTSARDYYPSMTRDTLGNIYIAFSTNSSTLVTTLNPFSEINWHEYHIYLAKFDPSGRILLDSMYIGGNGEERSVHITLDTHENLILTGSTNSTNLPTDAQVLQPDISQNRPRHHDLFICKLESTTLDLIFCTYLGSEGSEYISQVCCDSQDDIIVTGWNSARNTSVDSFPTTSGAYSNNRWVGTRDSFISKISTDGQTLLASTLLGGDKNDDPSDLVIDAEGNIIVLGSTYSTNFPTTAGVYKEAKTTGEDMDWDIFVVKFDANLSGIIFSTFLGDSMDYPMGDFGSSLHLQLDSSLIIVGRSYADNFPTTSQAYQSSNQGKYDIVIAQLDATGSVLKYASYFGGSDDDFALDSWISTSNQLYLAGLTSSSDFPITPGTIQNKYQGEGDAFLTVIDLTTWTLEYSTYIGTSKADRITQIFEHDESLFFVGHTTSNEFPASLDGFQQTHAGDADVFFGQTIPLRDQDGDGILNALEDLYGTALDCNDTDADFLSDGMEVELGTNPLSPDTDGDGVLDGVEYMNKTDPLLKDTDHDGICDLKDPNPLSFWMPSGIFILFGGLGVITCGFLIAYKNSKKKSSGQSILKR